MDTKKQAISEFTSTSISSRVYVRSLCYEYQFSFILKLEIITITKISHLDSLWKRDRGELGNGLFGRPSARGKVKCERAVQLFRVALFLFPVAQSETSIWRQSITSVQWCRLEFTYWKIADNASILRRLESPGQLSSRFSPNNTHQL